MRGALSIALAAALGGACAPERRPASAPQEVGSARALCEARCSRSARCDGADGGGAPPCACDGVAETGSLRADWTREEIACLARAECETEESCEAAAYRGIGAAPLSWPAIVLRCLQRGDECGGSSATCRRLAAMTDDARAAAARCIDAPCDAYSSCLDAFLAARLTPALPAWR